MVLMVYGDIIAFICFVPFIFCVPIESLSRFLMLQCAGGAGVLG